MCLFYRNCCADHLNQMQKLIGVIPGKLRYRASNRKYEQLFDKYGTLRLEHARCGKIQAKRLDLYFNMNKIEHRYLFDFVKYCLKWLASGRITANQFFNHSYFKFVEKQLAHISI